MKGKGSMVSLLESLEMVANATKQRYCIEKQRASTYDVLMSKKQRKAVKEFALKTKRKSDTEADEYAVAETVKEFAFRFFRTVPYKTTIIQSYLKSIYIFTHVLYWEISTKA